MPITQTITVLPTPPSRADPENFDSRADAFLSALPTMQTQMNTWASQANLTAQEVGIAQTGLLSVTPSADKVPLADNLGKIAAGWLDLSGYAPAAKGVTNGDSHNHDGGDGAQIAYSSLSGAPTLGTAAAAATTDFAPAAKGVTNGDSHDHNGGDGAQIAYSSLSGTPTLGTAAAAATSDFAPAAKGVTNGDSHNHDGGDGAQIAYSSLSGLPTVGKLRQVVVGTYNTAELEFSSETFVTINLAASITPTAASSTILIMLYVPCFRLVDDSSVRFGFKIRRDTTDILTQAVDAFWLSSTGDAELSSMSCVFCQDSPNSTSAISYNVQAASGTSTVYFYPEDALSVVSPGTIVLMEIAA